jgi:hypothetical protein
LSCRWNTRSVTCAYDGIFVGGVPSQMRVHHYFEEGARACEWLGSSVRKVHRTLESYLDALLSVGLRLTGISEGRPLPGNFHDPDICSARKAVPMYLTLRADRA